MVRIQARQILPLLFATKVLFATAVAQCNAAPSNPVTKVYFSQGMQSDSTDAMLTVQLLCDTYKARLESARDFDPLYRNEQYAFAAAINPTNGWIADFAQVLQQKAEEIGIADSGLTAEEIYNWIVNNLTEDEVKQLIQKSKLITNKFALDIAVTENNLLWLANQLANRIAEAMSENRSVSTQHLSQYLANLDNDERVIVIAYSQGNLFANKVVGAIRNSNSTDAESIKILGVATPASSSAIHDFYVTAFDDSVINLLRNFVGDVASGNVANVPPTVEDFRESTRHFFEESYFESPSGALPLPSRRKIDFELLRLAVQMPYPRQTSTAQYISFSIGNPGVAGDGISIQGNNIGPTTLFGSINEVIPIGQAGEAITFSVYSTELITGMGIGVGFIGANCKFGSGTVSISAPPIRGVSGRALVLDRSLIQDLVDFAHAFGGSECANVSIDDFYVSRVNLDGVNTIDAAAIGIGINVFPNLTTPPPN